MVWQRNYNFKNGTTIDANQANEEFNQLIAAVNQIQKDDQDKDANLRKTAQLSKITSDVGGVKISVADIKGDILDSIVSAGVGFYTFYAVTGSKNLPANGKSGSIRGISQVTGAGYAWIWATDYKNNIYTNYMDNGTWRGWHRLLADDDDQTTLWSGVYYMSASQTVTPSKKLSECRNGWLLLWSDYDVGVGSNDYDFAYSFIPRDNPFKSGQSSLFSIPNFLSTTKAEATVKRIYVNDNKLVGHNDNNVTATSTNDVCLRRVLEV